MSNHTLQGHPEKTLHLESRRLNPTVEEDCTGDGFDYIVDSSVASSSSVDSTTLPSRDEQCDSDDDTRSTSRKAPLARRDFAHELARSLWGVVAPKNFGHVVPGVYRSSYPKPENFQYLRTLGLTTILTLVEEELPESYRNFINEHGIVHYQIGIEANKDPKITMNSCKINAALGVLLQKANHPILVHCNKGKHRTGTVIGCFRKVQGMDMDSRIISEYRHYASHKARWLDERFIEHEFDERGMLWLARSNGYAPTETSAPESPVPALSVCRRLCG